MEDMINEEIGKGPCRL